MLWAYHIVIPVEKTLQYREDLVLKEIVEVRDLVKHYVTEDVVVKAVDHMDLTNTRGKFTAIV